MKHVTNFPIFNGCSDEYGGMSGVVDAYRELGLDGLEVIWDHEPYTQEMPPSDFVVGYHLTFRSYWVDFWKGDRDALLREFGDWDTVREYFGGETRADMVAQYRADLQRAIDLKAEYVVFHVSDVSLEEVFTYRFAHADREVVDCAAELVNEVFDGVDASCALLVENQWWPGFTFTDPAITRHLLDAIEREDKGIVLDTGHLLHTNRRLRTQAQAAAYVRDMFDAHADLGRAVRALHLHQSLSGAYVEDWGFRIPEDFRGTYWEKFSRSYDHILKIDQHQPWSDAAIGDVVRYIDPEWVNHELSAWPRDPHLCAVAEQLAFMPPKPTRMG